MLNHAIGVTRLSMPESIVSTLGRTFVKERSESMKITVSPLLQLVKNSL
jgi:hypothetical protein